MGSYAHVAVSIRKGEAVDLFVVQVAACSGDPHISGSVQGPLWHFTTAASTALKGPGPLTSAETLSGPSLSQLSSPPREPRPFRPQRPGTLCGLRPAGKDLLCHPDLQCLFPLEGSHGSSGCFSDPGHQSSQVMIPGSPMKHINCTHLIIKYSNDLLLETKGAPTPAPDASPFSPARQILPTFQGPVQIPGHAIWWLCLTRTNAPVYSLFINLFSPTIRWIVIVYISQ